MSRGLRLVPIVLFIWLVAGLAWRLVKPPDTAVPSQMINRPLPAFELAPAIPGKPGLASADFARGEPRLLNIFASWCVPCGDEAPVLNELRRRGVKVDAVAVRDTPEAMTAFLRRHGDPYDRIGADPQSTTQITIGSSGVPETFVVDGRGVIRHQYVGALKPSNIPGVLAQLGQAK
jgi:cytochrome c biogenesis protein CcmG/thiol:disulfide interchange protein DsbE